MYSPSLSPYYRLNSLMGQILPSLSSSSSSSSSSCPSPSLSPSSPDFSISTYLSSSRLPSSPPLIFLCPHSSSPSHVTIISGAGSGIGRATAVLFALKGARVSLVDIDGKGVEETKMIMQMAIKNSKNDRLISLHFPSSPSSSPTSSSMILSFPNCDVTDLSSLHSVFSTTFSLFHHIDSVFVNAGVVGHLSSFSSLTTQTFLNTLNVNVVGAFNQMKLAAEYMEKSNENKKHHGGGGSIIVTSSVASLNYGAGGIDYSASKSAVNSMVKGMSQELRGGNSSTNIRVNAICPGIVETGMTKMMFDWAKQKGTDHKIGQLNPLGRRGYVGEIAMLVAFLAGKESEYINGQMIPIDGGLTSAMPTANAKAPKELYVKKEKGKGKKKEDEGAE